MPLTRKYASIEQNKIKNISLSLATPLDVLEWSHGEVIKPETINYKSYKPESGGLFDELIFGPTTDFKCAICAKKYKKSNENTFCENTDLCKEMKPEILPKISRRNRMGHVKLNSPVLHFWFFKVDNSILAKLLGLKVGVSNKVHSRGAIEGVIYYKSHIVLKSGGIKALPENLIIEINEAAYIYRQALEEIRLNFQPDSFEFKEISSAIEELENRASSKMGKDYGIDFYELNEIIEEFSDAKIDTGAKAFEYLLSNFDLHAVQAEVKNEINEINIIFNKGEKALATKLQTREKLYKRLKIINSFINSGQDPKNMLIYNLPIIPADLRPLIQLDGGRHSTSDVNELYRRIIIRNNRLKKWQETDAPILIVQNELRMIQEAVDALIDNQRRTPSPVVSKDNRPLKSISDALTGKKGRFRQNLLGKRVDYSGRSVIVVGPNLKMHQAGIPREMAAKLFEPWIVRELISKDVNTTIKGAKKLIEELDPRIWAHVAKVIKDRPILLNRAPTLHRLSIQAFEPVLIRGRAIKLHPLVTTAFNADFDGDQMAVHVPISDKAVQEARELIFANRNILGPKDGEPIINPSQDMILGLFYLTTEKKGALGEGKFFSDFNAMKLAYENKVVSLHARVAMPYSKIKSTNDFKADKGYAISTVGKFIFNKSLPEHFPFIFDNTKESLIGKNNKYYLAYGEDIKEKINSLPINNPLSKKDIAKIIRSVFDKYFVNTSIREVAKLIKVVNKSNLLSMNLEFSKLQDLSGKELGSVHGTIFADILNEQFTILHKEILINNNNVERALEPSERTKLLNSVWFHYTNQVAMILDRIKELGFQFSTKSGVTISFSDILIATNRKEKILEGEEYTDLLKEKFQLGLVTDDERYRLSNHKWTKIKEDIQNNLDVVFSNEKTNSINMMIKSGARGNVSNLVQLAGIRGLMANNTKQTKVDATNEREVRSTVEVPVKSSFLEGLTAYEFYSSTHGARKGLTDTALNTAKSGYLTRRLVDVAQNIVVKEEDCGSDFGYLSKSIIDTKTKTIIVELEERIEGRYTNSQVLDENQNVIVEKSTLITPELADKIIKAQIEQVDLRTTLGCHTINGVCKMCYGKDLATNRVVNIGEAVGIIAAQSIGEPGTQLTMRTFHTGGVAGVEDITGGFTRLIELIDAYEKPWGRPAVISNKTGEITSIKQTSVGEVIEITYERSDGRITTKIIEISANSKKRVKVGDKVVPGQKITEGPIILRDLLKLTNARSVQNYILKEIQRLYRMQGISISDKYIEIIIRQMLSKIIITDPGDSDFFIGGIEDILNYQKVNASLITKGKKPSFGTVVIKGAKQTPLLSDSFLAAASYQETAKILVHSAISNQIDKLEGLKENIILGHKIPAGTGSKFEENSKFDLPDPRSFFENYKENGEKSND